MLSAMSKAADGGKLNKNLKAAMLRYGIDDATWDVIKRSKRYAPQKGGMKLIDPQNIDDIEIRKKIVGMIHSETQFAVPEPNARVRAMIHQGSRGGTLGGEFARAFGQLKTFPLTMMTMHWARAANMGGGASKLGYFASLAAGTLVMGALAQLSYDKLRGRDREMNMAFMIDAFDRGGLPGMFGDFVNSSDRKYGLLGFAGGPLLTDTADVLAFAFGTAKEVAKLESNLQRRVMEKNMPQAVKLFENFTPGKLWYTRLILDRLIFDQFKKATDPKWHSKQKRMRKKYREQGSQHWWEPGNRLP